ncbi:MAG: DUF1792 domain-containing protein [Patescibacteria group bacterium]|nr:DUF1792 domain-containing protein [Patescibacteria group bacterium]MDE1946109.1 DUF1792 domain-containing protein [Patescibacteria group bacterium]
MNTLRRIAGAMKKYLFRDTAYFFLYCFRYCQPGYRHECKFYSDAEFAELLRQGKSIIRLGDGEIGLLHYLPIHYQKWSPAIRNDFLTIIRSYDKNSPYMLLIPLFVNYSNAELKRIGKRGVWLPLKVSYEMLFNKGAKYFDAHAFYKDGGFEKLILPSFGTKKIIVVTNEKTIASLRTSSFNVRVRDYVAAPAENAYEAGGHIEESIMDIIRKSGVPASEFVVLFSAGLAKTIIPRLAAHECQALDIGAGLESYATGISVEYKI